MLMKLCVNNICVCIRRRLFDIVSCHVYKGSPTCLHPASDESEPLASNSFSSKSISLFSSHLCVGLPRGLFPSDFLTKMLYEFFFFPHECHLRRPFHS